MTETTIQTPQPQDSAGAQADAVDEQLAAHLVEQARERGISLVGRDGLLGRVTKLVLEGELTDHLGYPHGDPAGRNRGNSRNGTRDKTVITEVGPVEISVPRDRDGTFEPVIVRKRQRRLMGVEDLVVSLVAKGLTTGEVAAHPAEVYGTQVSRQTISTITDRVLERLPAAISTVWPQAITQTCVVHLLRNSFRYASRRDWAAIARDLRPIYTAPTEAAALEALAAFAAAWEARYPAIIRL